MSFPVSELLVGTVLLLVAAAHDAGRRRIPNAVNVALGIAGLWAQARAGGWLAAVQGLGAGALTLALLWIPWAKGRLGGGDVKMASGAAMWMGLRALPVFLLLVAVAGGLVAVVCYGLSTQAARREIRAHLGDAVVARQLPDVPMKLASGGRVSVPYGVAVAIAALALLWTGRSW